MFSTRFLDLSPLRGIAGTVRVPGSKSISNRALLLAGFAEGTTTISGLLHSDDTQVMLEALKLLGCRVEGAASGIAITGLGARPPAIAASLWLGNAGTAMRPLVAALALTAPPGARFECRGTQRMHERPIGDLVDALRALGCGIEYLERPGYPPLAISAPPLPLALDRPVTVRGNVSSQFLTALLMALPLRAGTNGAVVEVEGELISKPYVDITLKLLERFGVAVERDGWQRFRLSAASLRSPGHFAVEADASSASYFIAAAAIAARDEPLRIEGVGADSIQGDFAFVDAVRAMGARVDAGPTSLEVRRDRFPLVPITLDCNAIPDAAMTLAALALFADGATRLENIASWRVKETDRLAAMASELRKVGAMVEEGADWLAITPPAVWRAAAIDTYDDHRMAMAMSLAAFNDVVEVGAGRPMRIHDPRCVGKTWPEYFETLFGVADVTIEIADNGRGISPALLPKLFEPFTQGDELFRATGGLGLGLAISRELAALHRGTLTARSDGERRGSTFTLTLPCAALNEQRSLMRVRVLVVDDDPRVLDALTLLLDDAGAIVVTADSVASARAKIASDPPHALICDLAMPGEDGYSLVRELRAAGSTIPAIALTAHTNVDDIRRARDAGFEVHLAKPVDFARLVDNIEHLVSAIA